MEQRDRGRYDSAYNPFTGQYELRDRYMDRERARIDAFHAFSEREKKRTKLRRRQRRWEKIRTYLIWALIGAVAGVLAGYFGL